MSEKTKIEWASHTASPWFGCTEVSPGCAHCYARQLTEQKGWAKWGDNAPRVRSKGFWTDAYRLNRKAEVSQTEAHGVGLNPDHYRPRMFTSLMDWLDPKAPIEWLADFLKVVHECQNLDWLLLTKRPELFWNRHYEVLESMNECTAEFETWLMQWRDGFPPENVWLGVTVENQEMADSRIPIIEKIPAKVRWLSVEPLLEPIRFRTPADLTQIHWVVVGGESGSKRRDCGSEAITEVAKQCVLSRVPVFVKQDAAAKPGQKGRLSDHVWSLKEYPSCQ